MKKFFLSLALLLAFTSIGLGQGSGPITVKEVDGSPVCNNCRTFVFPNGSLTVSGNKVTVASGGGGGGSPGGSNTQVQYNAAGSFGGVAGFTFNGTSTINLGVAGTSVGAIGFRNATSGTITLQPVTGALGTVTLSLPAVTDTLVGLAATQTLTNKTLTAPVIATISNTGTLTLPTSTDTLVGKATTDTFTNKTLTASSNVLGGVTMTLGSDADGDMYYRASNVLTRLPKGTAGQVLTMNAGATAPEWAAGGGGGGITIGTTTITSGTNTRVLYNNSGVVGEYTVTGTGNAVLSASPTLTGTVAMAGQTNSGTIVQTSASATAFVSGLNGATTPAFVIDNSTASQASGMKIIGKADGTAPEILALSRTQITTALAGNGLSITADPAIAGSSVAGAAAGGNVTITAGAAARLTSGNANGGSIFLVPGAGIGTGVTGSIGLGGNTSSFPAIFPSSYAGQPAAFFVDAASGGTTMRVVAAARAVFNTTVSGVSTPVIAVNASNNYVSLATGLCFQWTNSATNADSTGATLICRNADANVRFGAADAASPVAQTISTQGSRAGTDSNVSGANLTVQSGLGTGNSTPSRLILRSPLIGSTGTTAQTATTGLTIINGTARLTSYTVATLPNPTVAGDGALAIVTDATLTAITGLGLAPTGGGANIVPVYVAGGVWLMF